MLDDCFQVVPLKTILDHQESSAQHQALKSLAFSVFTSCRWNLTHSIVGRSMTGFGPAAGAELFLKNKVVSDCHEFGRSCPFHPHPPMHCLKILGRKYL